MGLLTFSADDLLKLPLVRTIATILTVVLCVCPGIYMMYLHDGAAFETMNIFKLLLISLSMNILFYLGSFMIILILSYMELALNPSISPMSDTDDNVIRLRIALERAILITNVCIMFGICGAMVTITLWNLNFDFTTVLKAFKVTVLGFVSGWFLPSIIFRGKKSPVETEGGQ